MGRRLALLSLGLLVSSAPLRRPFLPVDAPPSGPAAGSLPLRVLQFNVLADGLSGLRGDFGAFSRLGSAGEEVVWSRRRDLLLREVLQYDPDVVCLQEVDHCESLGRPTRLTPQTTTASSPRCSPEAFPASTPPSRVLQASSSPPLTRPASACLEVSPSSDGCALFLRRSKLRLVSAETITFALASDITVCPLRSSPVALRPQNQVAILAVCEVPGSGQRDRPPASVIVATTHLKATKNAVGELFRFHQAEQLLAALDKVKPYPPV